MRHDQGEAEAAGFQPAATLRLGIAALAERHAKCREADPCRAAVGYCSSVTLEELADLLASPALQIQRALNMDGGSSSGFWFAGENGVVYRREGKTVRDYIAVGAR